MTPPHDPPKMMSTDGLLPEAKAALPKEKVSGIYVANTTFTTDLDGVAVVIHQGRDRVRAGHPLYSANPQFFDEVELSLPYDVEQASQAPGEKRGEPTKDELMEQARKLDIEGRSQMDKDELAKAVAKASKK